MKIGMLWFDNNPRSSLEQKVGGAVAYYNQRYGKKANLCYVHPSLLPGRESADEPFPVFDGVTVRPAKAVLPDHFWVGMEET